LPQIARFTLADRIHIAAMALVFLSILPTVIVDRIAKAGRPALAERLDKAARHRALCRLHPYRGLPFPRLM
jgi:hypothetical protein